MVTIKVETNKFNMIYSLLISFGYALYLSNLPLLDFIDRENYLSYTEYSTNLLLNYASMGLLKLLTNEPLWLLLNSFIGLFFSHEHTLRTIIFIPAFLVSFMTLRSYPKHFWLVLIILLFPTVIKNHIIHLRQGVAVSLFLLGYLGGFRSYIKNSLIISTMFIHSSFIFVVPFYYFLFFLRRSKFDIYNRLYIVLLVSLLIGMSISTLVGMTGARQAGRLAVASAGVSGVGFVFWFVFLFTLLVQKRDFVDELLFPISQLILYLCTYFTFPYTARVFESSLVIILLSVSSIKDKKVILCYGMILFLFIFLWAERFQLPLFGFAVRY